MTENQRQTATNIFAVAIEKALTDPKNKDSIYTTRNLYRDIEIINVSVLSANIATIDFVAVIKKESEKNSKKYRATLEYDFQKMEMTYDSIPKNPTGFVVKQYSITDITY